MRLAIVCLSLLPTATLADSFTLTTTPSAVTVYADAAKVTRQIKLEVNAGQHKVVLPGLPRDLNADFLRVGLDGASLGATQFRRSAVAPQPSTDSAAIEAAKSRIKVAESALQDLNDKITQARLGSVAAQAKSDFLSALSQNEGLPTDVETLRNLAQMIGHETLSAGQEELAAQQEARNLSEGKDALSKELKDARAALAALNVPPPETAQLTLAMNAVAAGEVTISLTYLVGASWQPVYDIYLKDAALSVRRGAEIRQWSNENWETVSLALSTFALQQQTAPREVFPIPLTFGDKAPPQPKALGRAVLSDMAPEPMMESAMMREEDAVASFDGPGVTYTVPSPVSVASNVDAVRVTFDTLEFAARRFARAAPRFDRTAFLMASFKNDTQEPLLASNQASLYLDNTLIGSTYFEQAPAGAEVELPFGPLEELRLRYTVLNQSEGDRGIITRSNARTETTQMDIQNIGADHWDVEVLAAVPYAVQEDLEIDWRASPAPDARNVKDKRGVLKWDIEVPAGTTTQIKIETEIKWPDGKILR